MAPEVIIDKDGNKMFLMSAPRRCPILMMPLLPKIQENIIPGSDFTRCDYTSFSK